ncbi:hypothetical protein, partial [Micromonospora sediminicola]|uniref:hypothetical protein n=1 Tax=Micromonospora sediminicola TaxID=946078 RepID=UPI0033F00C2A
WPRLTVAWPRLAAPGRAWACLIKALHRDDRVGAGASVACGAGGVRQCLRRSAFRADIANDSTSARRQAIGRQLRYPAR